MSSSVISDKPQMGIKSKESSQTPASSTEDNKPPDYERVSDDDLYRHSSQYRYWSYTEDNLEKKREEINERAAIRIQAKLQEFLETNKDTLSTDEVETLKIKASALSMIEETRLVNFYAKKVQVIAQHLNLPTEVIATSITFFRRFFLENSVMEFDPKNLVHTTIFLACKSENYFISVDSFAQKAKSNRDAILKYEFKLLESLKFSLLNHHPYKPLHGFFLDIQNVLHDKVDLNYMGQIYDRCKRKITDALLSDIVYLFTPPQITLAVFFMEDEQLITRYLELKFAPKPEDVVVETESKDAKVETESKDVKEGVEEKEEKEEKKETPKETTTIELDKIIQVIKDCNDMIETSSNVSTEDAKRIAAKNYYSQNPTILLQKLKRKHGDTEGQEESPLKKPKVEEQ